MLYTLVDTRYSTLIIKVRVYDINKSREVHMLLSEAK